MYYSSIRYINYLIVSRSSRTIENAPCESLHFLNAAVLNIFLFVFFYDRYEIEFHQLEHSRNSCFQFLGFECTLSSGYDSVTVFRLLLIFGCSIAFGKQPFLQHKSADRSKRKALACIPDL